MNENEKVPFIVQLEYYLRHYALEEAEKAASESSYGVGGVMVDLRNCEIIHHMHNTVIACEKGENKPRLKDPTAHGERQLVDWYFENKNAKKLPEPKDIAIITTLDPCCMCTGSILSAGFKVLVATLDDQAGINYDYKHNFKPFEDKELSQIKSTFIYPETKSRSREGYGTVPDCFKEKSFHEKTLKDCSAVFDEGAKKARKIVTNNEILVDELTDIKDLKSNHPIVIALKEAYPQALKYRAKDPKNPDVGLADYLVTAATEDKKNGGDGDAVAFLDSFGNLLMCKGGNKKASPIRTAFMEMMRAYQTVRYELTAKNSDALNYLCDPKHGVFIFVRGFDKGTQSFADMGAYGSSILGTLSNSDNLQYAIPRIDQNKLDCFIKGMPPRYRSLIKPKKVSDIELITEVTQALSGRRD